MLATVIGLLAGVLSEDIIDGYRSFMDHDDWTSTKPADIGFMQIVSLCFGEVIGLTTITLRLFTNPSP